MGNERRLAIPTTEKREAAPRWQRAALALAGSLAFGLSVTMVVRIQCTPAHTHDRPAPTLQSIRLFLVVTQAISRDCSVTFLSLTVYKGEEIVADLQDITDLGHMASTLGTHGPYAIIVFLPVTRAELMATRVVVSYDAIGRGCSVELYARFIPNFGDPAAPAVESRPFDLSMSRRTTEFLYPNSP